MSSEALRGQEASSEAPKTSTLQQPRISIKERDRGSFQHFWVMATHFKNCFQKTSCIQVFMMCC